MSKDIIYREDAIKAINARTDWYQVTCNGKQIAVMFTAKDVNEVLEKVPSADRPQGWVDKAISIIDDMQREGIIDYEQAWEFRMRIKGERSRQWSR